MNVHYDFQGRTVLVAGAASGIGRALALACLHAGADVAAGDVDTQGLSSLPADLALTDTARSRLHTQTVDLADSAAVDAWVQATVQRTGRLDGAVITSAIQQRVPIDEMSDAVWQRHLDVNLSGVFHAVPLAVPLLASLPLVKSK